MRSGYKCVDLDPTSATILERTAAARDFDNDAADDIDNDAAAADDDDDDDEDDDEEEETLLRVTSSVATLLSNVKAVFFSILKQTSSKELSNFLFRSR